MLIAGVRFEVAQVSASGAPPPPTAGCSYALQPGSAQVDASAAEGSVSLTAGSGCAWNAASDQPWLSVVSAASGTGDGRIAYRIAANDTGATRTAQITVGTASFTVQQAAAGGPPPPCTFAVDPDRPITARCNGRAARDREHDRRVHVECGASCGMDTVDHERRYRSWSVGYMIATNATAASAQAPSPSPAQRHGDPGWGRAGARSPFAGK